MGPPGGMYGGGGVDPQVTNALGQIQNSLKSQDMKMEKIKADLKESNLRGDDM